MRKSAAVLISVVCLFFFALLSKYEDRQFVRTADFTATVRVQDVVTKFCATRCDGLFEDIGFFASPAFSVGALFVLSIWMVTRKPRSRHGRMRSFQAVAIMMVSIVLLTMAEIYGKSIVRHPAPPFFMLKNPTTIFPAYHVWQEFSFPSGHAARAAFLGINLAFVIYYLALEKNIKKLLNVGIMGYILIVSISRIYLGHHWLSDVAGGAFLGVALGVLTWAAAPTYNSKAMSD